MLWVSIAALGVSVVQPEIARVLVFPLALYNALRFPTSKRPWINAVLVFAFAIGFNSQEFLLDTLEHVNGRRSEERT
jgi:hypothetical protein